MDSYTKLCEVGACLYTSKKYDLSIEVLNVAQKVATNQKGITMKVQLTLANAHSSLGHSDLAISLYQVHMHFVKFNFIKRRKFVTILFWRDVVTSWRDVMTSRNIVTSLRDITWHCDFMVWYCDVMAWCHVSWRDHSFLAWCHVSWRNHSFLAWCRDVMAWCHEIK